MEGELSAGAAGGDQHSAHWRGAALAAFSAHATARRQRTRRRAGAPWLCTQSHASFGRWELCSHARTYMRPQAMLSFLSRSVCCRGRLFVCLLRVWLYAAYAPVIVQVCYPATVTWCLLVMPHAHACMLQAAHATSFTQCRWQHSMHGHKLWRGWMLMRYANL